MFCTYVTEDRGIWSLECSPKNTDLAFYNRKLQTFKNITNTDLLPWFMTIAVPGDGRRRFLILLDPQRIDAHWTTEGAVTLVHWALTLSRLK